MNNQLLSQLSRWICKRTGLYFPKKRWHDLERIVNNMSRELGFDDAEPCARMLISSSLTKSQVKILIMHLTVGETYFFRDKRSLEIFEKIILPGILDACRAKGSRKLAIWSAGCATGEEPYSIAIILKRMMADLDSWDVTVMGTDINEVFLRKASKGVYSEWSFRDTPQGFKERYFKKTTDNKFAIHHHIKKMVTFSPLNLVNDYCTHGQRTPALLPIANCRMPTDIDVIFCRNVLMYFSSKHITAVVNNLYDCLAVGGYLIVSPSEVPNIFRHKFVSANFPGATFYKKDDKKQNVRSNCLDDPFLNRSKKPLIDNVSFIPVTSIEGDTESHDIVSSGMRSPTKTSDSSASHFDKEKSEQPVKTKEPGIKTNSDLYVSAMDLFQQGRYDESLKLLLDIVANNEDDVKSNLATCAVLR